MRSALKLVGALGLAALFTLPSANAATWKLTAVTFPEKKAVEVPFDRTSIAPKDATMSAEVRFEGGQAEIELKWDKMQPAVLFAGNITAYALWAVTRDGRPENLGEVPVREKKSGKQTYRSGQKNFAMIVTAEVLPGSLAPTELLLFTSGKVDEKTTAKNVDLPMDYDCAYRELVHAGNPSIASLTYTPGGEAIEMQQARKAMEMADALHADQVDLNSMNAAKANWAKALNASLGKEGGKKEAIDYSRRALENSGVAIRLTLQKRLEEAMAAEAARKKAADEAKQRELEAAKARASAAEAEKARTAAELDRMKSEREAVRKALEEAVGKTMGIEQTKRGLVVNMGDMTFDVNKATLKRDTELALAKISGLLSLMQKLNVRAEGFTDTTGSKDANMKLSAERARSVNDFLVAQGLAASRITHAGYGPADPVAPNDTAEGRKKNRRVELLISEGTIEATPGGVTAPERPAPAAKKAAKPAAKAPAPKK